MDRYVRFDLLIASQDDEHISDAYCHWHGSDKGNELLIRSYANPDMPILEVTRWLERPGLCIRSSILRYQQKSQPFQKFCRIFKSK